MNKFMDILGALALFPSLFVMRILLDKGDMAEILRKACFEVYLTEEWLCDLNRLKKEARLTLLLVPLWKEEREEILKSLLKVAHNRARFNGV